MTGDLDLDAIERRFSAAYYDGERDPAVQDVLALTAEVRRQLAGREVEQTALHNALQVIPQLEAERDAYAAQLESYDGQAWEELQAERDAAERRADAAEQAVARVRELLDILDDFDPGDVSPTSIIADDLRRALDGEANSDG